MQAALEVLHHPLQAVLQDDLGLPAILVAHLGYVGAAACRVVCCVLLVCNLSIGVDDLLHKLQEQVQVKGVDEAESWNGSRDKSTAQHVIEE